MANQFIDTAHYRYRPRKVQRTRNDEGERARSCRGTYTRVRTFARSSSNRNSTR